MQWVARVNDVKYSAFRWRYELSVPKKLVMALAMVALTTLVAQIRVVNPLMPDVPVTGQTFAVLLAGVLLGRWWGGISMALYAGLGTMGVPLFAGWHSGVSFTSFGYIIGFVFAALFLGFFTDKYVRSRSFLSMLVLMFFANFILIWVPGILWRVLWLNLVAGKSASFIGTMAGSVTYIPGDIIKAVLAALIARAVTPKQSYGGEVDKGKWANWRIP